jgi:KaiC/GvpD/RAD55 family RecA-like ATPase
MLKDAIEGLDNVFETDIPRGHVVMVAGTPGGLKWAFIHNLFSNYLASSTDEFGVYITLEETTKSHLRNMASLGIDPPKNLFISDHTDIRKKFEPKKTEHPDYLKMIQATIEYFKNEKGDKFNLFALDSLTALYSLIEVENLRLKLYNFFKELRNKNITTFVIVEVPDFGAPLPYGFEGSVSFLVDGIIQTGEVEVQQDVMIYMQVKKMRAAIHSRKKHIMEVAEHGLNILGPIFE